MASLRTAISETWNEQGKLVRALVSGVSAGIGGLTGNIVAQHVVESTTMQSILGGLMAGGAVFVGVAIFTFFHQMGR